MSVPLGGNGLGTHGLSAILFRTQYTNCYRNLLRECVIMGDDIRNVFISHVHEDDAGLAGARPAESVAGARAALPRRRRGGARRRPGRERVAQREGGRAERLPAPAGLHIKSQILAPQIQWASTLLVYITPETKDSKWVNWEIEYAAKSGKRIVGVYARGANECDVPEALDKYADDVRGWQSDGIVDAILGKTNEWRNPSGELRDPRSIRRYRCSP